MRKDIENRPAGLEVMEGWYGVETGGANFGGMFGVGEKQDGMVGVGEIG